MDKNYFFRLVGQAKIDKCLADLENHDKVKYNPDMVQEVTLLKSRYEKNSKTARLIGETENSRSEHLSIEKALIDTIHEAFSENVNVNTFSGQVPLQNRDKMNQEKKIRL